MFFNMEFAIDILDIVLRAVISISFLFIISRCMGKKQISQLTFFDYIIGISIGSVAASMASSDDIPYVHGITAMLIYASISLIISVVTNKSIKARRFFTGRTFLLIDNGKILNKNLAKIHYDVNDLLSEARNSGYFNIADVSYALFETNGKISFMPVVDKQPVTLKDLQIQAPQDSLTANVIIDGVVMNNNLKAIGLNEDWLKNNLSMQKIRKIEEIILATVDTDKNLSVYKKSDKVKKSTPID